MIKVMIISGFLGAGKTTFIKELVAKVFSGEKIVLIENEFGEIGVDSRFMRDSGIEVTEMNSGCICCTLAGDFARALEQVAEELHPDRVIIEPSGVGKLSDVAEAVQSVRQTAHMELDGCITVVDGKKAALYMQNFGEFFGDQIEYADTIVVSRTQTMDEAALGKCVKLLRQKNQKAAIITTPWEQLSAEIILSALEPADDFREQMCGAHHHHEGHHHGHDCGCHEHHHHEGHHHADEVFSSWGTETVHRFDRRELEDVLKLLSTTENFGTVLRAKGIVEGEDGQWVEFDMVPDAIQIRACPPDYTGRICVIGVALRTAELDQIFGR